MPVSDQHAALKEIAGRVLGSKAAKNFTVPPGHQVLASKGQNELSAIKSSASDLMSSQGLIAPLEMDPAQLRDAIRQSAIRQVGSENADKLIVPSNPRVSVVTGQGPGAAIEKGTKSLLAQQKISAPKTGIPVNIPINEQHEAIRSFAEKQIGPQKAARLDIPENWSVTRRPGQTESQGIKGSAIALMQKQGFIDVRGDNKISSQSKYTNTKKGRPNKGDKD